MRLSLPRISSSFQALGYIIILLSSGGPIGAQNGPPFVNPPFLNSSNGVLKAAISVAPATVTVAGVPFSGNLYNGLYAPPVLRVKPGDAIKLNLTNNISLSQPTNLHYHGFAVSPLPPSDDVFLKIFPAGGVYNYTVNLPSNHARGMFWYHPHPHGLSEGQVLGGLSGAMIVEGLVKERYPAWPAMTERVMLLKDIVVGDGSGQLNLPDNSPCYPPPNASPTKAKTVNGLCNPTITIAPGEWQFWRMANIGADAYFNLQLEKNPMYVIAIDGNATVHPISVDSYLLPPGARVEVVVVGPPAGTYQFSSQFYDTGPAGDPNPTVPLATLISTGRPAKNAPSVRLLESPAKERPRISPTVKQVQSLPMTQRRTFIFSENGAGNQFCINGCQYDMSRVDTTVHIGDVEEWTLKNTSGEVHAFHIHQLDFLVTEVNGVWQNSQSLQDTVNLPVQGEVKVIMPFLDPNIVGEFVYHCHILEHEDAGMMANIMVLPREAKAQERILERVHKQMEHAQMTHSKADPAQPCIPCSDGEKK